MHTKSNITVGDQTKSEQEHHMINHMVYSVVWQNIRLDKCYESDIYLISSLLVLTQTLLVQYVLTKHWRYLLSHFQWPHPTPQWERRIWVVLPFSSWWVSQRSLCPGGEPEGEERGYEKETLCYSQHPRVLRKLVTKAIMSVWMLSMIISS